MEKEKNYNLGKLLKPYDNKWVALSSDRKKVVASGNTLKEVAEKVTNLDVIFTKVIPHTSFYVPATL